MTEFNHWLLKARFHPDGWGTTDWAYVVATKPGRLFGAREDASLFTSAVQAVDALQKIVANNQAAGFNYEFQVLRASSLDRRVGEHDRRLPSQFGFIGRRESPQPSPYSPHDRRSSVGRRIVGRGGRRSTDGE